MSHWTRFAAAALPALLAVAVAGCGGPSPHRGQDKSKSASQNTSNNLTNGFSFAHTSLPAQSLNYQLSGALSGTVTWRITQQGPDRTLLVMHQVIGTKVEDDRVVLTRQGLRFISAEEVITSPGHRVTFSARVAGKNIVDSGNVDGKTATVKMPFGPNTIANIALLPTLAAVDVKPGQLQLVQDAIIKTGTEVPIGFTANDRTSVTTPAGTFNCVPVTLSGSGPNQRAFIDTKSHTLVQFVSGQTTLTLVGRS